MITKSAKLRLAISTTLASGLLFVAAPAWAQSLPDTGHVTNVNAGLGGTPGVTTPVYTPTPTPTGTNLQIDLRNNRTILNWGGTGFNIAAGNSVNFKDARATSGVTNRVDNIAVLNRDLSGRSSVIQGAIRSDPNVAVYMINTNGIVLGDNATVNVGSFFASSLDTTDADFFDGDNSVHFSTTPAPNPVYVYQGATINTASTASTNGGRLGDIVLVGPYVATAGTLHATGGDVGLAMARDVTVQNAPGSPLSFTIGAITNDDRAALGISGSVTGKNVIAAIGRTDFNSLANLTVDGTITATGAESTDRGIVLTTNRSAGSVTFAPGVAPATGSMMIAGTGTLNSAKDIWLSAAGYSYGAAGTIRGSVTASGLIDLSGNFEVGPFNNMGPSGTFKGGSIAVHDGAYFNTNVVTTAGNLTYDGVRGISLHGDTNIAGDLIGNDTGQAAFTQFVAGNITVGGKVSITTLGDVNFGGTTHVTGLISVTSGGFSTSVGELASDGDITLRASGVINLFGNVFAGGKLDAEAGYKMQVGSITGTHGVRLVADGNSQGFDNGTIMFGWAGAPAYTISAPGSDADLILKAVWIRKFTDAQHGIETAFDYQAGHDVKITQTDTTKTLQFGTVAAGGSVDLTSGGGLTATRIEGQSGSVSLNATGITVATVLANTDITSAGAQTLIDALTATTGNILVTGTGGTVRLGGATGGNTVSAGGNITVNSSGSAQLRGAITAGGDIAITGTSVTVGLTTTPSPLTTMKAKGAISLTATTSSLTVAGNTTVQSNSDGIGSEALTLQAATSVTAQQLTQLLGGTNRQSDIQIRNPANAAIGLGSVSARGLLGASGSDPFTNGLTRNAGIFLTGPVNLTNTLFVQANTLNFTGSASVSNGDVDLRSSAAVTIGGAITTAGDVNVQTSSGNLTIAATGSVSGHTVVLSTPGAFINQAGANAVVTTGALGKWLIYSAGPSGDTFGNLDSHHTAIWNATLATRGPDTLAENRYIFALAPTLTFSPANYSKVYGFDFNNTNAATLSQLFTVTGYQPGVAGAFLGDTAATAYENLPTITSDGLAERASVLGGPYAITLASNAGLVSNTGYAIVIDNSTNAKITVTPRPLDIRYVADSKTYDGTTAGTGTVVIGNVVAGDTVTASGTTWTFADKNAGLAKVVTVAGTTLGGADLANYSYTLPTGSVTADILKRALNIVITPHSKIYDGTTNAPDSFFTILGIVAGENVQLAANTLVFTSKNASGNAHVVFANTPTLSGADIANYTIGTIEGNSTDIFQKEITGAATVNNKIYDGTRTGSGSILLSGIISGDQVGTTGSLFTFADKNAGTGKAVTVTGTTLTGADAANYNLSPAAITGVADILKKALTGTYTANSKTYDGTAGATGSVLLSGVVQGDDVGTTGSVFSFADKNAGTGKTVSLTGTALTGADAANYSLTISGTAVADILKKALTGTITANSKTYDGTTSATGTVALNGVLQGDTVGTTGTLFAFADKNAGTGKTVNVSGTTLNGADAGNYTLSLSATATADILKKALTGTYTANSKTYDGTNVATGTVTLSGVVQGDMVGTTGSVFTFADKNAGTGKTVSVSGTSLSGADAANYTLTMSGTAVADILKKALAGTVTVNNKTYDGTTSATGTVSVSGVIQGDDVSASGFVLTFADKNAGIGKAVSVSGSLTGADAGNYTLGGLSGSADILKKALTGAITANSKTYDGTTVGTGTVTLSGVVQGDSVGTTGSVWTFSDKNAGTGKTVTLTGTALSGTDASNYTLTGLPGSAVADILKKALTGNVTITTRTYDGTTNASGSVTLSGVVQGDSVGTAGSTFTFGDKNAGTGKAVIVNGTTLTGADAANYTLSMSAAVGDILKKAITGAVTANSKTYDGTTAGSGTVTLSGVLQGDTVGTTGTVWTFADKNASTGKTVTITGTTLNGADGGNYTLTMPASALADILKKSITGSVVITSRQYDGTTTASGTVTLNGVVQGDTVGTSGTVLTFADKNAGTGKTVTVSGTTMLTGADADNYTLTTMPASVLGDILKRTVVITADNKTKNRNDDDPMLTFTITSGSLVSGDAFAGALTRASGEAPGSYAITIGSLALDSNYTLNFTPGVLTIVLNPAENQQQVLKSIPLPSQLFVPAAPASNVEIDKDALCGEDKACVAQ